MSYVVDHAGLTRVTSAVRDSADALDASASGMPGTGGTGAAEVVIAAILAGFSQAAVDVINECHTLADVADECNTAYQTAEVEAAESLMIAGTAGEDG